MLTYGVIFVLPQLDVRAHRMKIVLHPAQDFSGTGTDQIAHFQSKELQTW